MTKAMLLLKFARLPYDGNRNGYGRAPKGKLPYIDDAGSTVMDSTFIRFHIEKKYGFDFDAGLTPEQKATAWAIEKMCAEHLYLALLAARWLDDANFAKGPAQFFKAVPMPLRPIVQSLVRRKVEKTLKLQGFGRHTAAEQAELATADINALATLVEERAFLMGDQPWGRRDGLRLRGKFFVPRVRNTNPISGGKAPKSYRDRILRHYFPA